jgi:hypothetical protein
MIEKCKMKITYSITIWRAYERLDELMDMDELCDDDREEMELLASILEEYEEEGEEDE